MTEPRTPGWRLPALYLASMVLTLGEGSLGILIPVYLDSIDLPSSLIGSMLGIYGVAALASRFPASAIYSPRRAPLLVVVGCLAHAAVFAGLPLTQRPVLLAALIALNGFAFGFITTITFAGVMALRPAGSQAGSIMGWYSGAVGFGYAIAGILAGRISDLYGVSVALQTLVVLPLLAGLFLLGALSKLTNEVGGGPRKGGARLRFSAVRRMPSLVWLAFFICVYLSLVHSSVKTFFPIYGLGVGFSMTEIGILVAVASGVGAAVRFFSGVIFKRFAYLDVLTVMILLSGVAFAATGLLRHFWPLVIVFVATGLARGLLRVASGAMVMDEHRDNEAGDPGVASALYLAGLDVGKIIGPVIAGGIAQVAGIPVAFVVLSVVFVVGFLGYRRRLQA